MFKYFDFLKKYKYLVILLGIFVVLNLPLILILLTVYGIVYGLFSEVYKYKRLKYIIKNLDKLKKEL